MQLRSKRRVGDDGATLLSATKDISNNYRKHQEDTSSVASLSPKSPMKERRESIDISPKKLEEVIQHEEDHPVVETILSLASGPLSLNRFRSNLVGLSCLLIGLPGLLYLQKGQPFMGFVGGAMGLFSFYSDYVFACPFSFDMKFRRRAFAIDLFWISIYLGGIFVNLLMEGSYVSVLMLFCGISLGKILFLDWSARAQTPAQWEFRHSCWHAVITGLAFASHGEMLPRKELASDEADVFHTCVIFMAYAFVAWLLTTITDFILAKSEFTSKAKEFYLKWSRNHYPSRLEIIRSVTWNGR